MRPFILAGAMALAFAGAAAAQSNMTHGAMSHGAMGRGAMNMSNPGMASAALPTPDYIMKAGQSDQFEIQEGQLASQMAHAPAVKTFGREMVTAHHKTTETLMKTLQAEGKTPPPPPALSAEQQAQIDQLRGLSGDAFDREYVRQQMASHREALAVQANYAKGGSDPKLRTTASGTVPVVQGHLRTLTTLQAKVRGAV